KHSVNQSNFMDQFAGTAEAYDIEAVLIFNKVDTFSEETLNEQLYLQYIYDKIGYKCMRVSAVEGKGLDKLKAEMTNKVSMFTGHSGVGKSTLVNALEDRKSTRLNSSHVKISYAVFCLKKKIQHTNNK